MSESKGSELQNFKEKIDGLSFEGKVEALIMFAREEGKREAQKEIETRIQAAEKLACAARHFAARVLERNPEWFQEERGTTDFSEADWYLREALAEWEAAK